MKQVLFILLVFISFQGFSQIQTVKLKGIGLEVMTKDLGKGDFTQAKELIKDFGDEWRLPTTEEVKKICKFKDFIGGFANDYYWSSTGILSFSDGTVYNVVKSNAYYVRAVRSLK